MTSSLDRLKAAAARGTSNAPAAQAPENQAPANTTTPAAPPTPPAPTAPQNTAPAQEQASSQPAAQPTASSTAVTTPSAEPAKAVAPSLFTDGDEAERALANLYGESTNALTAAQAFDSLNDGFGMSFQHPFAQLRKGNWSVETTTCPKPIYEFMPAGDRPFTCILMGHRLGATGWIGEAGSGKPPAFKYAIPHVFVNSASPEMIRQTVAIGSKIQYKKVAEEKWKHLGKLTPEIHCLVWTPDTGYIILAVSGFTPSELSLKSLTAEPAPGESTSVGAEIGKRPLVISVLKKTTINQKAAVDAKNRQWNDFYLGVSKPAIDSKRAIDMNNAWAKHKLDNKKEVVEQTFWFLGAGDFNGLKPDDILSKLTAYNAAMG